MSGQYLQINNNVSQSELQKNIELFNNNGNKGKWLIKYYADWCGHCNLMSTEWNNFIENNKDNLIKKGISVVEIEEKNIQKVGFDIRFHLLPSSNAIKTQDRRSILLQLKKSGLRFSCNHSNFGIETGLYFGKKDSYTENKNIYVHGEITSEEEKIKWEIKKI